MTKFNWEIILAENLKKYKNGELTQKNIIDNVKIMMKSYQAYLIDEQEKKRKKEEDENPWSVGYRGITMSASTLKIMRKLEKEMFESLMPLKVSAEFIDEPPKKKKKKSDIPDHPTEPKSLKTVTFRKYGKSKSRRK